MVSVAIFLTWALLRLVATDQSWATIAPLPAGMVFLGVLWLRLGREKPSSIVDVVAPFPSWNLYLLAMGVALSLFPWSLTLRNVGLLPLFVMVAVGDGLLQAVRRRGLELGTVTAAVGLVAFAWLWEAAGSSYLVVLPVDLPQVQNPQFTSTGIANALLAEVTSFPPNRPNVVEEAKSESETKNRDRTFSSQMSISTEFGGRPFLGWGQDTLQDPPHILGEAELGGIHLEPVYHSLRHLRHKPTLEAQILIGHDGSLTLALHRSDFPPSCFSERLPDELLNQDLHYQGTRALRELQATVDLDISGEIKADRKWRAECYHSWPRRVLDYVGLAGVESEQDELISNVTVAESRPDEQLTVLIRRALLEGMGELFPEQLGLYFDGAERKESALYYYRKALPRLVQQASQDGGSLRSRSRTSQVLMRIADLETRSVDPSGKDVTAAFDKAARHFKSAVAITPEDAKAHAFYGDFLVKNSLALRRDGQVVAFANNMVRAIAELRTAAQQASTEESTLGKEPASSIASYSYKNLAYAIGLNAQLKKSPELSSSLAEAQRYVDRLLPVAGREQDRGTKDPEVLAVAAFIKQLQGNCDDALETFGEAFNAMDVSHWDSVLVVEELHTDALHACGERKRPSFYSDAMKKSDADLRSMYEAFFHFALAVRHNSFGIRSRAKSDLDESEAFVAKVSFLKPDTRAIWPYSQAQMLWGRACDKREALELQARREMRRDALVELDRSLSLNPDDGTVRSYRAKIRAMSTQVKDDSLAATLMEAVDAVRMKPREAGRQEALGAAQLRLGDFTGALDSYRKAASLGPDDPAIHYSLGFTLMEMGRVEPARDEWRYGESLNPERWKYIGDPLPDCGPIAGVAPGQTRRPSKTASAAQ